MTLKSAIWDQPFPHGGLGEGNTILELHQLCSNLLRVSYNGAYTYSLLSLESFGTDFRACVSGDHQSFYGEHVGVKWSSSKGVEQNSFPGLYLCPCKSPGIKMQTNLTTQPSTVFPTCTLCHIYIHICMVFLYFRYT